MDTPDLLQEVRQDVKEIKLQILELVKQGLINTITLTEHERRSANLETRVSPLEDFYKFFGKAATLLLFCLSLIAAAASLYKLVR